MSELIARLLQPSNGGLTPSESIAELLREAERLLRSIKSVDLSSFADSARQEHRYWHNWYFSLAIVFVCVKYNGHWFLLHYYLKTSQILNCMKILIRYCCIWQLRGLIITTDVVVVLPILCRSWVTSRNVNVFVDPCLNCDEWWQLEITSIYPTKYMSNIKVYSLSLHITVIVIV